MADRSFFDTQLQTLARLLSNWRAGTVGSLGPTLGIPGDMTQLAQRYGIIPNNYQRPMTSEELQGRMRDTLGTDAQWQRLLWPELQQPQQPQQQIPGYAQGGRPEVGEPAIVGENGPEVFVPDQPG